MQEAREFRAITGISMGGYGALNLGTRHDDIFGVIGSLGGPVDLQELLRHIVADNLEVKRQTMLPMVVGDDFTFDHLPAYPGRDSRLSMIRDLVLAFGNPFLHHENANQSYLAAHSQPALLRVDDELGDFSIPTSVFGFFDGGDSNEDGLRQIGELPDLSTEVLLLARGTLLDIAGVPGQAILGERALADLNADGIFDVGDGIVVNYSEPFTDVNANLIFEPQLGESFSDFGLDGVPGSGDFGEANGVFDYDPDVARWLAEDPLTRLQSRSAAEISAQRIYMDVGTQDEFGFEQHYLNLVAVLESKGLAVEIQDGFDKDCLVLPDLDAQFTLVRYDGGHIGFADSDTSIIDLLEGDVCGSNLIWQRILSLIGAMNESFPDGFFGTGGLQLLGDVVVIAVPSPALAPEAGGAGPDRQVVVYRPPAYHNTGLDFPIVYFLGGHGQDPDDFVRVGELLDLLILTGQVQNMILAFLPGEGGTRGSFYVNHAVPDTQAPLLQPTSGRYEDSVMNDLIPFVEHVIVQGRIKH